MSSEQQTLLDVFAQATSTGCPATRCSQHCDQDSWACRPCRCSRCRRRSAVASRGRRLTFAAHFPPTAALAPRLFPVPVTTRRTA